MVYGCGNKSVKLIVFAFSFLIFVGGVVICGVSIGAATSSDFKQEVSSLIDEAAKKAHTDRTFDVNSYTTALWVLAVLGGFLAITGFLGCCGAWAENRLLLGLFFFVILLLFLLQLGSTVAAFVVKDKVKEGLEAALTELWNTTEGRNASMPLMDTFKCCGVHDGDQKDFDWCVKQKYTKGCLDVLWNDLQGVFTMAGIVSVLVLVVELITMVFTCVLIGAYGRQDGYSYA